MRRAEEEILAGTLANFRRIVAVVARARPLPVIVAAARVKLNAMTAMTSQAALAVKTPEGRCAKALLFRSEFTSSITAWARWVLSAVTVSRVMRRGASLFCKSSSSSVLRSRWPR